MIKKALQAIWRWVCVVFTPINITLAVAVVLITCTGDARADTCAAQSQLSPEQYEVVQTAYQLGEPEGLGYSLAAIVWKESSAGKYLINTGEHSYGPFQINLNTAMARMGGKEEFNQFQKNRLATKLLDLHYSSDFAIKELKYWISVHGHDWLKVWASYNGGWRYAKNQPRLYALDIAAKIRKLKGCFGESNGTSTQRTGQRTEPIWTFR